MSEELENETKLEDIPEDIKYMAGFDIAWNEYQKWLRKEKEE